LSSLFLLLQTTATTITIKIAPPTITMIAQYGNPGVGESVMANAVLFDPVVDLLGAVSHVAPVNPPTQEQLLGAPQVPPLLHPVGHEKLPH